jgi:small subunit ribosomal protein S16
MLKIKLSPRGKTHQISYRVVISPDRSKFDGKFIDDIGFYTPQSKTLQIDQKKLKAWQEKGAQVTLGLDRLLNPKKYPKKPRKVKKQEEPVAKTETKTETN